MPGRGHHRVRDRPEIRRRKSLWNRGTPASGGGRNRPSNEAFWIHPPGDTRLARFDDGIALILITESPKQVIKLAIHLGNPGLK